MDDKKRKGMELKKVLYTLLICFMTFAFTGCKDMTEFEDRDFVLTLGLSAKNNSLKATFAKPDLKALTGQPAEKSDKLISSFTGKNLNEIEETYSFNSEKKLDYNHLKAIILESSMTKDSDFMKNILTYIEENYNISRNTKVFVTNEKVDDIISLDENVDGSVGDYLERYYKNNRSKEVNEDCSIGDLINAMNNKDQVVYIPVLKTKNKKPIIEGIGLFNGKVCTVYLGEEESKYTFIGDKKINETSIILPSGYTVKINNMKSQYKYSIKDNLPYVYLQVNGNAKVIDYNVTLANSREGASNKKIKEELDLQVKNMIAFYFDDLVKNRKIDFLNLYRRSSIEKRKIWIQYRHKQKEFLNDVLLGIVVDFKMKEL